MSLSKIHSAPVNACESSRFAALLPSASPLASTATSRPSASLPATTPASDARVSYWLGAYGSGDDLYRMSSSAPAFADVLRLRSLVYGRPTAACRDDFDASAEHYVSYRGAVPVCAVRIHRASTGPIECEAHYPSRILEHFRARLSSGGRLLRNPELPASPAHTRDFVAACWVDQLNRGTRVDIVNAVERLVPYYRIWGYHKLPVPSFRHPRWGTESHNLCFLPGSASPGSLRQRLPKLSDSVQMSDIIELCNDTTMEVQN
ncbi:hypothetical protein Hoch_1421 [Haliangium ochraceum DSM 14365]|uniref:Uncharacterized protein n=2 Tax=Haliangium ochraceum TaxID=80816 RepID=D0LUT5_HALO1|nr:hypothetical protein Hoch_1421 [Haliangium ochraceum DSM 14365]